jgi:hypothetical protein
MLGIELVAAGVGAYAVAAALRRRLGERAARGQIDRRMWEAEHEIEEIGRRTREAILAEALRRARNTRPGA